MTTHDDEEIDCCDFISKLVQSLTLKISSSIANMMNDIEKFPLRIFILIIMKNNNLIDKNEGVLADMHVLRLFFNS